MQIHVEQLLNIFLLLYLFRDDDVATAIEATKENRHGPSNRLHQVCGH